MDAALLVIVVVVALGFDFTNGFHDTANAVATSVSTRALTPRMAVLIAAIAWNLLTWWLGLPSSSSHALIGGLVGAALVQSGSKGVEWHGLAHKVVIPALIAPTVAFFVAFALLLFIYWAFQWLAHGVATRGFRLGQLVSGTFVAFSHGANDAQKTMGVIALALYTHGSISQVYVP